MLPEAKITLAHDCIGEAVETAVRKMQDGEVLMLENLLFHPGEKAQDDEFASQLAGLGEVYCNESFGTAHRKHASMIAVPAAMSHRGCPCVAGFLLRRELKALSDAFDNPKRPFVAVLGGAKVSDKLGSISNVIPRVDTVLIGDATAYTFLLGQGIGTGASMVEKEHASRAMDLIEQAKAVNKRLLLPVDHVCAQEKSETAKTKVTAHSIPDGWMGLDIGPKTIQQFTRQFASAKTIYWNGPVGLSERGPFATGTRMLAEVIALATKQHGTISIIGGGDSAAAVVKFGLEERMTHVSTGGGASLCMLERRKLHCLDLLDKRG